MDFTTFAKGDTGFHFGTFEQASRRISGKRITDSLGEGGGRIFRTYLNIQRPVLTHIDIGIWQPYGLAPYLESYGYLSSNEVKDVLALSEQGEGYHSPASAKLREILESKGYDGIFYPNFIEGEGYSYMVFHDDQIIRSEILQYRQTDKSGYSQESAGFPEQTPIRSPYSSIAAQMDSHNELQTGWEPQAQARAWDE